MVRLRGVLGFWGVLGLGCFGFFGGVLGYLRVLGVWRFWGVWGFWGVLGFWVFGGYG